MPQEDLTKDEIGTVKRWYDEKKRELGLGKKPVLSYFGFEGLALRWKRKYGALDIGDFRASIDLLLSFEESLAEQHLERLAKREEEFAPEEEYIPEEEPTAIESLGEEVLDITEIIKRLQNQVDDLQITAKEGVTPELRDQIRGLRTDMERVTAERAENEKLLKDLRKEIRELSFYAAGAPVKEEAPPIKPTEIEEIVGAPPLIEVTPPPPEEEWEETRYDPETLDPFKVPQPYEEKLVALCKDAKPPSDTNMCGVTNAEIARDMKPERRKEIFGTTFSRLVLDWLHIIPPGKITMHNFSLKTFKNQLIEHIDTV